MIDPKSALAQRWIQANNQQDVEEVRELLAAEPELQKIINEPWCHFDSPPIVTAKSSKPHVELLLQHGADINARSEWWAGSFGILDGVDRQTFEFLVGLGAHPNLYNFAQQGLLDQVNSCLDDAASANQRFGDGQTALHVSGSVEVIDTLLRHGADPDLRCHDHSATPAQYLVTQPELCRRLLEQGATPDIFIAAALDDIGLARKVISRQPGAISTRVGNCPHTSPVHPKADRHIYFWQLKNAMTPLEVAAERGFENTYQFLFDNGSERDRFLSACWQANSQAATGIMARSPTITRELDGTDFKELARAAWKGKHRTVELMLKAGFDPHVPGDENSTPLDRAAFHGFHKVVKLLLQKDPKPPLEFKNKFGGTPLSCCIWGSRHSWMQGDPESNHKLSAEYLIQAGSRFDSDWIPTANPEMDRLLEAHLKTKQ